MGIIVDLIIVGILVLCIFLGYKRGLTGSLLKIVTFLLALIIAFILFKPVSNFIINNTKLDENLESSIKSMFLEVEENDTSSNMPTAMTDYINKVIEDAADDAKTAVVETAARDVAISIINLGVVIVVYIIARIILIFVKGIASLITKLPVIKQFDKLGGIIYGILEGLIIVYVLLAIISFVSPMVNGSLSNAIEESFLGSIMYNNNLLLKIIF